MKTMNGQNLSKTQKTVGTLAFDSYMHAVDHWIYCVSMWVCTRVRVICVLFVSILSPKFIHFAIIFPLTCDCTQYNNLVDI